MGGGVVWIRKEGGREGRKGGRKEYERGMGRYVRCVVEDGNGNGDGDDGGNGFRVWMFG